MKDNDYKAGAKENAIKPQKNSQTNDTIGS
jgi:hypothetical protein